MLPDRVSNPRPLTYESGALQIALRGPAAVHVFHLYSPANEFNSSRKGGGRVSRWRLVNFQCRDVLLLLIIVGQWPTVLNIGAGRGCLDIYFSFLS